METVHAPTVPSKRCPKCGQVLPRDCFFVKVKATGRLMSWCKACMGQATIDRYRADPARGAAIRKAWCKANPARAREIDRATKARNADKNRLKAREYAAKNKGKKLAYRKANVARIKARNALYRSTHADQIKAYNRAYIERVGIDVIVARHRAAEKKKPELYKAINKAAKHRRKVRITNNGPVESFGDREIFNRDNWICHLCGKPVDPSLSHPDPMSVSLDHITPIVKGGGHTRANTATAHLKCNLVKRHLYERLPTSPPLNHLPGNANVAPPGYLFPI